MGIDEKLLDRFEKANHEAWSSLRGQARKGAVSEDALETASRERHRAPGAYFALLLDVAFKDRSRREAMVKRFREDWRSHPAEALGAAGYNLHEYHPLLDEGWMDFAREAYAHDPEGAWGILESAAMYETRLVTPELLAFFEARKADLPRDHFVVLLSLAEKREGERAERLERVLRDFDAYPAAAVEAASFIARDQKTLLIPPLVDAVLRNFGANAPKAWEFFDGLSRAHPEGIDDALLEALSGRPETPGTLFSILSRQQAIGRYTALLRRHPKEGIEHARYAFSREDARLLTADIVRAVCAGFEASPYAGYSFLRGVLDERPELLDRPELEAAIRGIDGATNYAFGFFAQLLKTRPEFSVEAALALFECLAREPHHRAFLRAEELDSIQAISEAATVRTGLEKALRLPPRIGSRRARALMAILFRQTLRSRRHVLIEALRHAGGLVQWRKDAPEELQRWSPVWDFTMFLIEEAGGEAVSTAAAERFLEGAFQLSFLCRNGAEYDAFLKKLDLERIPEPEFPEGLRFLARVPGLGRLRARILELGRRFEVAPDFACLREFAERGEAMRRELAGGRVPAARAKALEFRLACLADPAYRRAFDEPAAEAALSEDARRLLRTEKKALARRLEDALRAEAVRIAEATVEGSKSELYRSRLKEILGREVDGSRLDPRILPSFLWFPAVRGMPGNREGLRRLIEDRVEGRGHDWLRSEGPAAAWAEKVRSALPDVRLERWRAPFERTLQYRPADASAEKRRRVAHDLQQARELLEKAGGKGLADAKPETLAAALAGLRRPSEDEPAPDPALLDEVDQNLRRAKIALETPESDYEGRITLSVESDPFEILFMGEHGFASCLSLRGSNAWSAVSNAIDVDKTVVWARDPGGNVVGRRLITLQPEGLGAYRTYVNRNGLALDAAFESFLAEYARHVGVPIARRLKPGPLLSDRWYDDGMM